MGKNNKGGKKPAAVPPAPNTKAVEPEVVDTAGKVNVIDANGLAEALNNPKPGLDANHQVDLLNGLDRHFMQPNAAQKLGVSQETVDKVTAFTAHGWVAIAATEGMFGTSAFAQTIRASMLPAIVEAANDMGMKIDQKMLPAPAADGTLQIPSDAIKPSKEAKEQLKKEHEILEKKPNIDPTKIENDEELKDAINFVMADAKNGWEKIKNAIQFYRSYLTANATKNNEDLEKIKNKSDLEILDLIKNSIHDCPIVLSGMGRAMGTFTGSSKSPIIAFCMLRDSVKDRKTGECELSDREISDYARAIVSWVNDLTIENYEKRIADHNKNLEALKKDKKKNAKGIEDVEGKIESCKNSIEHCKEITESLINPSTDIVDSLIEDYSNNKAEGNRVANAIFGWVVKAYYSNVDREKTDLVTLKHNVQQRAGIIVNLFRDPTTPNPEYNEANLTEMPIVVEDGEEKKELRLLRTRLSA